MVAFSYKRICFERASSRNVAFEKQRKYQGKKKQKKENKLNSSRKKAKQLTVKTKILNFDQSIL